MPDMRHSGADKLRQRRWTFAGCVFDESNWTLSVDRRRVPIETKPLEMLRELLLHAGNVVTKDQLLDTIWPSVTVVEASLPTAVHKLRVALGDDRRDRRIVETVPGIGYRLGVPAEFEDLSALRAEARPLAAIAASALARRSMPTRLARLAFIGAGLVMASAAIEIAVAPSEHVYATSSAHGFTQRDAANALRKLDIGAVEKLLAAGWDPNTSFDDEGNGAINYSLNLCEWDPQHDQRKLQLMVRTLLDGGAQIDRRNVWGDTPYSIAKAKRYCGPDHPVTKMLRTACYAGYKPPGDRCLASYELKRRSQRRG